MIQRAEGPVSQWLAPPPPDSGTASLRSTTQRKGNMNTASKFTPTNVVFGSVLLSSAALLGCGGADGASELDAAPDPSTWAEEDSPKWSGEAPEPAGTPPEGLADEALEPTLVDEPVIDKMHNGTRVRGRGAIQVSIYQDVTDPSSKGLCSGAFSMTSTSLPQPTA
jgi:hypothetical protein